MSTMVPLYDLPKIALSGEDGAASPRRARILLVDDEPRLLDSLHDLLKDGNYELATASSGSDAIGQLSAAEFDLALLDLRMRAVNGLHVMDFITARKLDMGVVVVSGDTRVDAAIEALKRGAVGYLRKPYHHQELLNTVENALQRRRLEAENRRISWQLTCSESLYRYLVDSSPDIIYTLDKDGRFTFVNERTRQLLGFGQDDLIGKHYSVLIHEDDIERARYVFVERRIGERASRNVELRLKSSDAHEAERTFNNSVTTISFNSFGMYALDRRSSKRQYFGTYGIARDVTERKRNEELISYQAYHDALTDLPNRALFRDRLEMALIHAERNNTELAVMFLDLDRFKLVNDTLGHAKGDELLQQVARRLKDSLRRGDTLARIGGDEFIVLLPELRGKDDAGIIADKFLECIAEPFFVDRNPLYISASIGTAIFPADGDTMDDLIRHADIAMYQVKASGKNAHTFYDHAMQDIAFQRIALEQSLRGALEQGQLEMYYQPQLDVISGSVVGAEGLIRWNHPERGLLAAGEFLSLAEENGLLAPINDWMVDAACRDLHDWKAAGIDSVRISLNVSPQYLESGNLFVRLRDALQRHAIDPSQVGVEVTENICIRNPQHAIDQLVKLGQLGVNVAIDDFGTGYSSLAYLHRFPIHTIKIDQTFVRAIQNEDQHFPVILAVISMAQSLGLDVIAEGVETECQKRYLLSVGCAIMQGFLFFEPLTKTQFMERLFSQTQSDAALRG